MSAIAGLWRWDGYPGIGDDCKLMLRTLAMYGADRQAHRALENIAFGHCLTRLLPEDALDAQPLHSHGHLLVADLRLDNRDELISALSLPRDQARQIADSGILFAALERWGDDAPDRLVGDYAFAFWDAGRQRLLLARDPFGGRPLHFHRGRDLFAFASMPKGLHALPGVPCTPDLTRLSHRVAQLRLDGDRSFYHGIERVEPAHLVVVTRDGINSRRHWHPGRHVLKLKRPEDYAEALREVLDLATASRLRGVEDVATQLSGGLDSSSVTVTAARIQAARGKRAVAFTAAPRADYIGPETRGRFGDESGHAAAVAALYDNLDHVVVRPSGIGPLDDMDSNFYLYDKPLLNFCNAIWMHGIYDAARARGLRVLLVGDKGNETISYDGRALFAETFAQGRITHWMREGMAWTGNGRGSWLEVLKMTFGHWLPADWKARIQRRNADSSAAAMMRAPIPAEQFARYESLRQAAGQLPADSLEYRMESLRRFDRGNENKAALAGWGIDRRDPTCDRRVVEFCLSVPTDQYFRNGVPASLLRRAMADRLPGVVLEEQRRGLQAADWHEGVTASRDRIRAELDLLSACQPVAERLDIPRLRAAVEDWPQDGWERPETQHMYRSILLRSLSAGCFAQRVLSRNV